MKKVAYKIEKQQGGSVTVKNFGDLDEVKAKKIARLLESYGFAENGGELWEDFLMPDGPDSVDLEQLAAYVPIKVQTTLSAKGKARFRVSLGEASESLGPDLTEAVTKAHGKWNREGRPLRGVQLAEALHKEVEQINKGLRL